MPQFLRKLQEKRQSTAQQQQAREAISFYYEVIDSKAAVSIVSSPQEEITVEKRPAEPALPSGPTFNRDSSPIEARSTIGLQSKATSPPSPPLRRMSLPQGISWKPEYARLMEEIKLRHYSPKTLRTYKHWVRHYQTFTRSPDPKVLSTEHVK